MFYNASFTMIGVVENIVHMRQEDHSNDAEEVVEGFRKIDFETVKGEKIKTRRATATTTTTCSGPKGCKGQKLTRPRHNAG